jgi:hypothetical protein
MPVSICDGRSHEVVPCAEGGRVLEGTATAGRGAINEEDARATLADDEDDASCDAGRDDGCRGGTS